MDKLTNKQRCKKVRERSQGLCEICYSPHMVQNHHIIGGSGKRKQCETVYSLIALCYEHHHGTNGIHGKNGNILDTQLKEKLQRTYEDMGIEGEDLRYWLGGKYYLERSKA